MDALVAAIAEQKAELDALRPLTSAAMLAVQKHFDVELTYTSNAIEGNTLTLRETAEVIEHGITVGGKPLKDHLEAVDHYDAVLWMRELAGGTQRLGEDTVCELHRRIVARSRPDIAGHYSPYPRRIAGSAVVFPNPRKIPDLMAALGRDLEQADQRPETAFDIHFRLTAIHPFSDGNGRTARLLMNLMLLRAGYPPVAIGLPHRRDYLDSLEVGSLTGQLDRFQAFMHGRLCQTLQAYLDVLREALSVDGADAVTSD